MCCILSALALLGPRFAIIIWWIADPERWERSFDGWLWPVLGFVFLPFTTLMYVVVRPGGVSGFDLIWLALAVLADVAMYSGSGYGNRDRVPGYGSQAPV
jgi:hypothetical protein